MEYYIYIIQETETGHIKIGYAQNLQYRLSQVQVGNPRKLSFAYTELFGSMETAKQAESLLHAFLQKNALSGEWFEYQKFYHEMLKEMEGSGVFAYLERISGISSISSLSDSQRKLLTEISQEAMLGLREEGNDRNMGLFSEKLRERSDWIKRELINRKRKTRGVDYKFRCVAKVASVATVA